MHKDVASDTSRAWIDVNLAAVVRNARSFMDRTGVPLIPMLKANGYGLGALAIARALEVVRPFAYGVATVDEAAELHEHGLNTIVFCPLATSMMATLRSLGARPTIGDRDALRAWIAIDSAPFHVEIDTGMARSGIQWDDAETLKTAGSLLRDAPGWEGIFTMFHSAGHDPAATAEQWRRLQHAIELIGARPRFVHASASAAGQYGEQYAGDLARPGIHLYGGRVGGMTPEPVAALRSRVVAVRRLDAGMTVGYDATWTAPAPTSIATLSIGYADGLSRHLSNRGIVELMGRRVRIVGRVTMDYLMLDVGDLPIAIGDVATIFGGTVSLEEQAALAETISYEMLTSLSPRLPRRYVHE